VAVISGAAIAYHSGEPEFTHGFFWVGVGRGGSCCSICSILCSVLYVFHFVPFFWPLYFLSFGHCIFFLSIYGFWLLCCHLQNHSFSHKVRLYRNGIGVILSTIISVLLSVIQNAQRTFQIGVGETAYVADFILF
jgi:hypothetical protein